MPAAVAFAGDPEPVQGRDLAAEPVPSATSSATEPPDGEPAPSATPSPTDAPDGFQHPGVLVSKAQLDLSKRKISAGEQPWKSAFEEMRGSEYAGLDWEPKARAEVECGSRSNPNHGCSDEREDGAAAYTHALMWYFTGDSEHARKAAQILDAWSETIKSHTNSNAPLQTGWSGTLFARAGEILRHTDAGWPADRVDRFATMLRTVYLPTLLKGAPNKNGNWELIMLDAATGIAVFLDDRASFDQALGMWRKRLPAYIYLESDGPLPVPPPRGSKNGKDKIIKHWQGQRTFVDGLSQETCRDFGHTTWGFAGAINVAETARHQGVDLYAEGKERLIKGLEFHAEYALGKSAPSWLCDGELNRGTTPTWEIGYNHYAQRLKAQMPQSKRLIEQELRPTGVNYFIAWETLTHAGTP